ncbi:MAG: hypothetical protein H0X02_05495 [Nitrosomonas sp.]|nr:hypothetical protein [Nitrosomonas sp.]
MIELKDNRLNFSFPEIHPHARCSIGFKRTFRLPDDNNGYPLPPDLGQFPLMHVDDIGENMPAEMEKRGGVLFPMNQAEAMWIHFETNYPFAIKIAAGNINAITGNAWNNQLHDDPQDYLVLPKQPWLDGFCVGNGKIRQFIAIPLGKGYTAEEQLTGRAEVEGIQIIAFPLKLEAYTQLNEPQSRFGVASCVNHYLETRVVGLGAGGLMWQDIYEDIHDLSAWAHTTKSRCFVHLVNSETYQNLTGKEPLPSLITAKRYADYGLPWFKYYDENSKTLSGQIELAGLDSVAALCIKKNGIPLSGNASVQPINVQRIHGYSVREEEF